MEFPCVTKFILQGDEIPCKEKAKKDIQSCFCDLNKSALSGNMKRQLTVGREDHAVLYYKLKYLPEVLRAHVLSRSEALEALMPQEEA